MMEILIETYDFISQRNAIELIYFFWFFFVFDFSRYVLADTVFLLLYFVKRHRKKSIRKIAGMRLFKDNPLVSVIAPGKNEGKHIPALADSLTRQTYKNIEVIIVDDGSDDNTPEILRRLKKENKIDIFLRNEVRGGKASAANLALQYSNGEFVVHLDADTHLQEDSIEQILIPFYMEPNVGAVGGDLRVKNNDDGLASSLQAIDYMKSVSTGRVVNSMIGILRIISGAFGAFRKDVLDQIHGWDVGPGLDGDITLKFRKLGYEVIHEPHAVCYTNVPDTFRKLAKQRYRWDRSLVRFRMRKHIDFFSFRSKNFDLFNFFTVLDNILFNLLLNLKWWVYIVHISFFHTEFLKIILIINYCLYFISNCIEYILAVALYGKTMRKNEYLLCLYIPLMPIYTGFYLRIIRTYAHIMEFFFKASFDDKWNPWKVSKTLKTPPKN